MQVATKLIFTLGLLTTGCGGSTLSTSGGAGAATGSEVRLEGLGATFPMPLFNKWIADYRAIQPGVKVNYQGQGSSAGIKNLTDELVDFAASDAAMSDEQMAKVGRGVKLLPITAGKVVLVYNLPDGPKPLKLSRDAYVGIFLGKVKTWDDAAIKASNPDAKLPNTPIGVVHRAEGSGTTFVFTQHLAAISADWAKGPGKGQSVNWPTGVGAKGNDGVTAQVKQNPSAFGYVEYGFAKKNNLAMAWLQNKAGKYVEPTTASGQAGLAAAELPANLRAWAADPPGKECYPIVTFSWALCYGKYPDAAKAKALQGFISFCLTEGQKEAEPLGYLPLPEKVAEAARRAVSDIGS